MSTGPAPAPPIPAEAFAEHVCDVADKVPILFHRHLKAIAELHAPRPEEFRSTPSKWAKSRDRVIAAALQKHAGGRLDVVLINSGEPIPVGGPFYRSDHDEFDVPRIVAHLSGRSVDRRLGKDERATYSLTGPLAESRTRDELADFLHCMSFVETKAFDRITTIYFYLRGVDPDLADSFRYSAKTPPPHVRYDDILDDFRPALGRHWVRGNPETGSCTTINRGAGPVRVLSFVRPIPAEALLRIKRRFDEAGQAFELW